MYGNNGRASEFCLASGDTTAEVAAFNAYLDRCKEKVEDDGTEERVLSCLGALKRDAARFTVVK